MQWLQWWELGRRSWASTEWSPRPPASPGFPASLLRHRAWRRSVRWYQEAGGCARAGRQVSWGGGGGMCGKGPGTSFLNLGWYSSGTPRLRSAHFPPHPPISHRLCPQPASGPHDSFPFIWSPLTGRSTAARGSAPCSSSHPGRWEGFVLLY